MCYNNPMGFKDIETKRAWYRERYRKNCEFVQNYKVEKGCADCGWNEHHAGLEFDHLADKVRSKVANLMGSSMRVILEEIFVCEVVCARCHAIRTWERLQK